MRVIMDGHQINKMVIKLNSLLQKFCAFPDEDFSDKISNRFGFNVITN